MSISLSTLSRSTGAGLLVYGLGTAVAFMAAGSPGGAFSDSTVSTYVSSGHFITAAVLWYVVALSALGLLVAAPGLGRLPRVGDLLARLATVGAGLSVTGAFVSGGVTVAMAEGGTPVRTGVAHPVVYALTEVGNLLAVCAPALCMGVAALVLATRVSMPGWLRVFSYVGGICGVLAPLFFTYFVFVLWTAAMGITVAVRRVAAPATTSSPARAMSHSRETITE